jgi:cell division protease FtsH
MSPALGRTRLMASDIDQYIGGDAGFSQLSTQTHEEFDQEVRRLISAAEVEARRILEANRTTLDEMARRLKEEETLEGERLEKILAKIPEDQEGLAKPFTDFEGNGLGFSARKATEAAKTPRR